MRTLLLYIVILMHVNTMLIPIMNGSDSVDAKGRPHDEINSVIEYVYQVMLNNKDRTPEDEDSEHDQSAVVSYHKGQHCIVSLFEIKFSVPFSMDGRKKNYFPLEVDKVPAISYDICVPPPDRFSA